MYNSFGGYIKSGFKLISKNPILFIPKIISTLFIIIIAGIFIFAYKYAYSYDLELLLDSKKHIITIVIICFSIWILIDIFLEAGQLHMIKKAILKEEVSLKDFIEGIKKYSGRFIGGNLILTFILIIVSLLFALIIFSFTDQYFFSTLINNNIDSINQINKNSYNISLIVLSLIFIIPLIILSIFISFWKTILVYEDCKLTESFSLSFKFVKRNFWISIVYQFIMVLIDNIESSNKDNKGNEFFPNFHKLLSLESIGIIIAVAAFILKQFLMLYIEVIYFNTYDDRRNIKVID